MTDYTHAGKDASDSIEIIKESELSFSPVNALSDSILRSENTVHFAKKNQRSCTIVAVRFWIFLQTVSTLCCPVKKAGASSKIISKTVGSERSTT